MNDKMKKIFLIVIAAFVLIFIFLFMITSCKKNYSPDELESIITENAMNYYERNTSELPEDGDTIELSLNDLVVKGIIDDLNDILDDDTNCSGTLTIENNNNYYMYSPNLSCVSSSETYNTVNLEDSLMEQVTTTGNGLYFINNAYYFRGDNVDNYIIFDGLLWRITKVNSDGSIRLIQETRNKTVVWDNRHNVDRNTNSGYNDLIYNGLNSRIKDTLDEYYENEDVLSNAAKGFIKKTTLCVGKRNETDTLTDGSIECSSTLSDQYLGLLQANEFMLASLDSNCTTLVSKSCKNYNYLANLETQFWTLTADASNNYKVFKISTTASSSLANSSAMARIVINISKNTNVTGSGTEEDPYIVVGLSSDIRKLA